MVKICQNCAHWVTFTLGRVGAAWPSMNLDTGFCHKGTKEAGTPFVTCCMNCCEYWEYSGMNANVQKGETNE